MLLTEFNSETEPSAPNFKPFYTVHKFPSCICNLPTTCELALIIKTLAAYARNYNSQLAVELAGETQAIWQQVVITRAKHSQRFACATHIKS